MGAGWASFRLLTPTPSLAAAPAKERTPHGTSKSDVVAMAMLVRSRTEELVATPWVDAQSFREFAS